MTIYNGFQLLTPVTKFFPYVYSSECHIGPFLLPLSKNKGIVMSKGQGLCIFCDILWQKREGYLKTA